MKIKRAELKYVFNLSLGSRFFLGIFLELQKRYFFLVARPLPSPPLSLIGHATKSFFCGFSTAELKYVFIFLLCFLLLACQHCGYPGLSHFRTRVRNLIKYILIINKLNMHLKNMSDRYLYI